MRPSVYLGFLAILILVICAVGVLAQTAISTDGIVESTAGGFKFPDGSVQITAAAGGAPVEDSGQTLCFDEDGNSRSCTGTGEDGEFQAGVTWPTPRFADNGDGTVTDNLTGLIWLKDAFCTSATWQGALDWVASFNGGSMACTDYVAGTFSDWRLPSIKELLSLADYGRNFPAVPEGSPFVSVGSQPYWSSSTYDANRSSGWSMEMDTGGAEGRSKTSSGIGVWPVRGGG